MSISSQQKKLMDLLQSRLIDSVEADVSAIRSANESDRLQLLKSLEVSAAVLSDLSSSVGLKGLAAACVFLKNNFQLLCVTKSTYSDELLALVESWAAPLSSYFHCIGHSVDEDAAVSVIVDFLGDSAWPSPVRADSEGNLKSLFAEPFFLTTRHSETNTSVVADEMISLHIASDIDTDLVDDFLSELSCQAEAFDCAIEQFLITDDAVQLRVAQRIAHTLKGLARLVGVRAVSNLMHFTEDALNLASLDSEVQSQVGLILQDASDCLAGIDEYLNGRGPKPEDIARVMRSLMVCINQKPDGRNGGKVQRQATESARGVGQKVFHLENLIAFNDPGLKRNPPIFTPEPLEKNEKKNQKGIFYEIGGGEVVDLSAHSAKLVRDKQLGVSKDARLGLAGAPGDPFNKSKVKVEADALNLESSTNSIERDSTENRFGEGPLVERPLSEGPLSEVQRAGLLELTNDFNRVNAQILTRLEVLSARLDAHDLSLEINSEIAAFRKGLLDQGQLGISMRRVLGEPSLGPESVTSQQYTNIRREAELPSRQTLIVCVGPSKVCILADSVKRILYVEHEKIKESLEGCFYELPTMAEPLSIFKLNELIFPKEGSTSNKGYSALLLIDSELGGTFGVMVESIDSRSRQRVKPLGQYDHKSHGAVGTTMLDGGAVSPVIDLLAFTDEFA